MKNILVAAAFAVLVHPVVMLLTHFVPVALAGGDADFFMVWVAASMLVIVVSAAHVLLLGIPLFLLFKRYELLSWPTVLLAGGFCGALPVFASELLGNLATTSRQWPSTNLDWGYVASQVAWLGAHGVMGAAAFYAVWRRMQTNNTLNCVPARRASTGRSKAAPLS